MSKNRDRGDSGRAKKSGKDKQALGVTVPAICHAFPRYRIHPGALKIKPSKEEVGL